jgi:N-methylhydantoinase A/oxoprolinase/acetone carboxylase beta subunit
MVNLVPRGLTTCVDAYLTPLIHDYLEARISSIAGDV